jgi:hypothetical protein
MFFLISNNNFKLFLGGKTSLTEMFSERGFQVLDEAFVDMPKYDIHPQSLLMETIWLSRWSERLLRLDKEAKQKGETREVIYIADRSPYSAEFYAKKGGHLLSPLIACHLQELAEEADVHVYTVHVRVDPDLLWKRIQKRLQAQPERLKYNEDSREWMHAVLSFYDSKKWDYVVHNNEATLESTMTDIIIQLSNASKRFRAASPVKLGRGARVGASGSQIFTAICGPEEDESDSDMSTDLENRAITTN